MDTAPAHPLSAPMTIGFDYTRSTGPVIGRFVNALKDHRVEGIRGSDGRLLNPLTTGGLLTGLLVMYATGLLVSV